jgi:hypothetical protein
MRRESNIEAMFTEWLRTQRALIDEWAGTLDGVNTDEGRRMVEEMMRTWRKSVEETLEMQRAWASAFAKEIEGMDGISGDTAARIRESAEGFGKWADAQRDIWGEWFSMASDVVPHEARSAGEDLVKTASAAMQVGLARLVEANKRITERMNEMGKRS